LAEFGLTTLQAIGPFALEGFVEAQAVDPAFVDDKTDVPAGQGGGVVVADVLHVVD